MIEDIKTIVWKEFMELLSKQGGIKVNIIRLIVSVGVLALYIPFIFGRSFVESPYILFLYIVFPIFMMIAMVLDSFAGERERHTLETLLASRLSDYAILFGKILSAVIYGWGTTLFFIILGLLMVNVFFWSGYLLIFPAWMIVLVAISSLLADTLVAATGVLISLRTRTVRQGMDILMAGILAVMVVPFIIYYILPYEVKKQVDVTAMSMGVSNIAIVMIAILIALNAVIMYIATRQFQRNRLILE